MTNKELKYAWAAGLIDGEGCLTIIRRRPLGKDKTLGYRPVLKVTMRDSIVPYKLLSIFKVGRVHQERRKELHGYYCDGSPSLRIVLPKIIPYLTTKKPQARLLLKFLDRMSSGGRKRTTDKELKLREKYFKEMQHLKNVAYGYEL